MSEAKEMQWSKAWQRDWLDAASVELDMCAVCLRQLLQQHAGHFDGDDVTGWVRTDTGAPFSVGRMAAIIKGTPEQVLHSLGLLRTAGVIVERDGAWGVVGWRLKQETPEAARVRRHRATRSVTPAVTPGSTASVTPTVTVTDRGGEDRGTELTIPSPSAGGREEIPSPAVAPRPAQPAAPMTLGARLTQARDLVGCMSQTTAATRAHIPRGLYAQLEADEAAPTRKQLAAIAGALGQPEIADWPLPDRDAGLVERIVRLHRDLAVELEAMDPALLREPLVVAAHDVTAIYAAEATDRAAGLSLADGWARVLTRAAEQLRRELARGRLNGREYFTLRNLAGKRRATFLGPDAFDLDRRDEGPPARASPRRSRGPAPPQNHDRLTDGEIPT